MPTLLNAEQELWLIKTARQIEARRRGSASVEELYEKVRGWFIDCDDKILATQVTENVLVLTSGATSLEGLLQMMRDDYTLVIERTKPPKPKRQPTPAKEPVAKAKAKRSTRKPAKRPAEE